jgi:hypothetical protein
MQTSFMHPPFGFALFYLRSVAPRTPISTRSPARSMHHGGLVSPSPGHALQGQIYWGAVPFVAADSSSRRSSWWRCCLIAFPGALHRWCRCTSNVAIFGDLPPQILLVAERHHAVEIFLKPGFLADVSV